MFKNKYSKKLNILYTNVTTLNAGPNGKSQKKMRRTTSNA